MSDDVPLRCYYEVLGVDRKATYDEIRSAYKKMALIYHPDKNHGGVEEAAIKFKEVQNAYAVLSDDKEREWYDAHRESILRGDDDGNCAPDELNIFEYFSPRCFKGFGDDAGGFFGVYGKVFDTLIEEEAGYDKKAESWPRFGSSETPYAEVAKFYIHWRNLNSFKTFAWKDEYKINEIPDRQSRRAAERINQKERSAAKKEYVANVIELATFAQRRDPRVLAETARREEEEKLKAEEREKKEQEGARRRREANQKLWEETAAKEAREDQERADRGELDDGSVLELLYEKQRKMEQQRKKGKAKSAFGRADDKVMEEEEEQGAAKAEGADAQKYHIQESHFHDDDDAEAGEAKNSYNCPACKKTFHSENQWKEHVSSSKHKTKLKQLAQKGIDVDALMQEKTGGDKAAEVAVPAPPVKEPLEGPDVEDDEAREAKAKKAKKAEALAEKKASKVAGTMKDKKGHQRPLHSDPLGEESGDSDNEEASAAPVKSTFGAFASLGKKKR